MSCSCTGVSMTCRAGRPDRKSTRLNSSHANISYAVFCLKKKNEQLFVGAAFGLAPLLVVFACVIYAPPGHLPLLGDVDARWRPSTSFVIGWHCTTLPSHD